MTNEKLVATNSDEGSVGIGFAIGAICNVGLVVSVLLLTSATNIVEPFATICAGLVLGIGVVQLAYILPFYFRYKKKGGKEHCKRTGDCCFSYGSFERDMLGLGFARVAI